MLCAARYCWPIRDKKTPKSGITWARWFEARYGRRLDSIPSWIRAKKEAT